MSDVTRILSQIEQGDPQAAEQLLPLVYDELRKLAAAKLAHEKPGQTLDATALVHEAYLRLIGKPGVRSQGSGVSEETEKENLSPDSCPLSPVSFDNRGHFFAAAAEAMRRILTDTARRKQTFKHGGRASHAETDANLIRFDVLKDPAETLAVHELLDSLAERHPRKAEVVKLRYFLGCTQEEAAQILGITPAAAHEDWVFARAWLKREWRKGEAV